MDNSDAFFEKATMQELIEKLEEIQFGLRKNLSKLHQNIELFSSKHDLRDCLENLKKDVDTRASDLEAEVKRLQEDLKSIRELLGLNLDKHNHDKT